LEWAGVPEDFDVTGMTVHETDYAFGVIKKNRSIVKSDRAKRRGITGVVP
jgi:hypothetical protein